jgi:hypothetical protein
MALLDCFSGYHQIWLRTEDKEKTIFITPFGTYYYLRMPEGLCNSGPPFYRMTKAALKDQVGKNVLSYVDDIVVLSKKKEDYLSDFGRNLHNYAGSQAQAKPRKMCVWDYKGEGPRLFSTNKGHRSKPQQDQGNHSDATSAE